MLLIVVFDMLGEWDRADNQNAKELQVDYKFCCGGCLFSFDLILWSTYKKIELLNEGEMFFMLVDLTILIGFLY